jgi:predicted nucleotidyltransferase
MNNDTQEFIERLKRQPDIVGIILFGSWARGNNRLVSDVDLVVIVTEGFKRTVEYNNAQAFEIIYTTE